MKRITIILCAAVASLCLVFLGVRANENFRRISLPTSKMLTLPVPGFIARTNSFPTTIALSPNGQYAAFLNQGYGTQESGVRQSIARSEEHKSELQSLTNLVCRL